ncbi:MAG: hypothetical protein J7K46_08265 [Bacteroidales bacterium]|nr:hypothetical protein [Bacteroidales bacterium]
MNQQIEFIEDTEPKVAKKNTFRSFIDGTVLANQVIIKQLPYILFLTFLAMIYIGNRYHAEKIVRESTRLKKEIQELRAESISTSAELMYKSTKTQVLRAINKKNLGLEEPVVPPGKIVIEKGR